MTLSSKVFTGRVTYIWVIENCPILVPPNVIESPSFIVENTQWHITLLQEGLTISLRINRDRDGGPDEVGINVDFSFLDRDGCKLTLERQQLSLCKGGFFETTDKIPATCIFENNTSLFAANNTLTVRCRLYIIGSEVKSKNLCFARTCMGSARWTFIWSIKNFSTLQPGQEDRYNLHPIAGWCPVMTLILCKDVAGNVHIIVFAGPHNRRVRYNLSLWILDETGKLSRNKYGWNATASYEKSVVFIKTDEYAQNGLFDLPNDVLTLKCFLDIGVGPLWSRIE